MTELTVEKQRPFNRAETEAEVAAAVDSLAEGLSTLIGQVHPRAVISHTVSDARTFATSGFAQLKSQVVGEHGLRTGRVAILGAAVVGTVAFVAVVGSILRNR